ncbi:hypothetical protein [Luteococcus peritonei]|uniref:ABC-2 type transporter transmembrane domain-containing protein n=1 Tax=Luteococcus peritonei TaxID=88874 RepID=A0ABW4RV15_9ACTN
MSTTETEGATARRVHSTWTATWRTAVGAALAVTLVLLAFAWPTHTSTVRDMPLGVVATAQQKAQLEQALQAAGGAFTLTDYSDEAAARSAIEHREVYGALVLPADAKAPKTTVLTASAAGPAASQMITAAAQKMGAEQAKGVAAAKQQSATALSTTVAQASAAQASVKTLEAVAAKLPPQQAAALQPQLDQARSQAAALAQQVSTQKAALEAIPAPQVDVVDVVPLASTDSRGAGFAIAGLPLAMGGMIGGIMISTLLVGWKRRLLAVAGYGVLGGLGLALVLHGWFGFVQGNFFLIWLVLGLAVAATASFIVGAQSLLGQPGIALGAVVTMFIGNPIASLSSPKEWLPWHWGEIGQWFVPGAAGNLMRVESYFPHAPQLWSWVALLLWLLVGVALTLVGRHKDDEVIHLEGYVEPDAPRRAAVEA